MNHTLHQNTPSHPTPILSYNHQIPLKAINLLRQFPLKLPRDLSVMPYDDSHFPHISQVNLTSVNHPKSIIRK
ncbi:substrate-binding domain-containing protein, partial [Bacillus velezensis]|uniref:substrate-binding domain-containing protein n=1 Tax=Bacillus velezensis TaxID=492670 RepID=UPI0021B66EBB